MGISGVLRVLTTGKAKIASLGNCRAGLSVLLIAFPVGPSRAPQEKAPRSNVQGAAVREDIRISLRIASRHSGHQLAQQAVPRVPLQNRVSSSVLRLQSQEFVAHFLSKQTRLTNLRTILVPDFQGALAVFEQS